MAVAAEKIASFLPVRLLSEANVKGPKLISTRKLAKRRWQNPLLLHQPDQLCAR